MIEVLELPLCNTQWARNLAVLPFRHPAPGGGKYRYPVEERSCSLRLARIGVTSMADNSVRLSHHGPHGHRWDDAGTERQRYRTYNLSHT